MEIKHQHGTNKGKFSVSAEDKSTGEMTYTMESPEVMSIEHTMVQAASRGNNIGLEMLDAAVAYARENKMKIRPVCSFVQAMFNKHPEKYEDIIIK